MRKMKIMLVIGGGEKGGSRNHIITLAEGLRKKGVLVELICFLEDIVAETARAHNIPVKVFPMKSIIDLRVLKQFQVYINKKTPHLLHTHGVRANFIGRLAGRNAGIPIVTTVHSSIYHDYSKRLKRVLYQRIEKLTRPFTNRFIAVAESLRKELISDGVRSDRIEVVYNGLSPDFIIDQPVVPFLRAELGIAENIPILITVGRIEEVKNQAMLLQVFATLKQNNIDFHGVIVGDGPLLSELQEQARKLEIDHIVHFLGFRKDIFELLSEANLFILTSRMEGLPITLLESMAANTPIIATNVGGMPEVVRLAQNGYIVPVDDVEQFAARIQEILVQPELNRQLAEKGRSALQTHFAADKFIEKTIAVYQIVIAKQRKRN